MRGIAGAATLWLSSSVGEPNTFPDLGERLLNQVQRLNAIASLVGPGLPELPSRLPQLDHGLRHVRLPLRAGHALINRLGQRGTLRHTDLSRVCRCVPHAFVHSAHCLANQLDRTLPMTAFVRARPLKRGVCPL